MKIFWRTILILGIGFLIACGVIGLIDMARADSILGQPLVATFTHTAPCDSVRIQFGLDSTNFYVDAPMVRISASDSLHWVYYRSAGLASVGVHIARVWYKIGATWNVAIAPWLNSAFYVEVTTRTGDTLAVMSDTLMYQGQASGLTAPQIANTLLDTLLAHGIPGSGVGPEKCTLLVKNYNDSTIMQGVKIVVTPHGGGEVFAVGNTDINGRIICNLDTGFVDVAFQKQAYAIDDSLNLHVTGDDLFTFYGLRYFPDVACANCCGVWGVILSSDTLKGTTINATVVDSLGKELAATNPPRIGNTIMSRYKFSSSTRTSTWSLSLPPNADITPAGSQYKFEIKYPSGTYVDKTVTVPDSLIWELKW